MKLIPCPSCSREAVGPATAQYPAGVPVVFGRYTGGPSPIVVKCFRCMRSFKLDAQAYARLPEMTADQMRNLGVER